MLKTQRWFPDTCGCIIDSEWDDSVANPDNTLNKIIKCPAHYLLTDNIAYVKVQVENKLKNIVFNLVLSLAPALTYDDYQWLFDKQRVLQITIPVTSNQKTQLQKQCDNQFGKGQVGVL